MARGAAKRGGRVSIEEAALGRTQPRAGGGPASPAWRSGATGTRYDHRRAAGRRALAVLSVDQAGLPKSTTISVT
jgi:hypothetical protein